MEQPRRIPTLFAILLIALSVGGTVFAVSQITQFRSRADASQEPKDIKVTNISDRSFTVTWLTDGETVGYLNYGPTSDLGINVQDDRKDNNRYTSHHVTVEGLEPTTKYYFKVGSGAKVIDQNGSPFEVTTASATDTSKRDIVSGFVMKDKSQAVSDALVLITVKDSIPLSTLTNAEGQYRVDLAAARDKNLLNQIAYNPTTDFIDISVKIPGSGEAVATTTTANSHPIPPITLGAVNDFTKVAEPTVKKTAVTVTPIQAITTRPSQSTSQTTSQTSNDSSIEKTKNLLGIPGESTSNTSDNSTSQDTSIDKTKSLLGIP